MKTVRLPHDSKQSQGTWWIDVDATPPCIRVSCPECGVKADLQHAVGEDGRVFPSLICPGQPDGLAITNESKVFARVHGKQPCGFHANVILDGWPKTWSVAD